MKAAKRASISIIGGRGSIKLKDGIVASQLADSGLDVLYFGVAGAKSAHFVLRFDLRARALTAREPEKGTLVTIPFTNVLRVRSDKGDLTVDWELKPNTNAVSIGIMTCYNQFDFDAIIHLSNKMINLAADVIRFSATLKPQLCFMQETAYLKKQLTPQSEMRVILVERTVIIHAPNEETTPAYLVPLWKRPCFTTGKNGIRFDMRKKSVDIFFQSEDLRDAFFAAIQIAALKTPSDSVPLRRKLESIVALRDTTFEPHNPHHFAFAQRLWDATIARTHPGAVMPDTTESELWKELGFTTTSLGLDLKVCNLLGLVNLVYYAENYPSDLDDLLQLNRDSATGFAVAPTVARVSFMVFTLLSLGKKQTTWYPTFVTYPMWNYDWAAYEMLVCIAMRLFQKLWTASTNKAPTACMNDLVADLSFNLSRPPSEEGVPYVFSMFRVLLGRKSPASAGRLYVLPDGEDSTSAATATAAPTSGTAAAPGEASGPTAHPWSFAQKAFLSTWIAAPPERRSFLVSDEAAVQSKAGAEAAREMQARRAERKRLEARWEDVKSARNEFKDRMLCRVCAKSKRAVVVLPCAHLVVCRKCVFDGMRCPHCKDFVVGFVEILFDDNSLSTLR